MATDEHRGVASGFSSVFICGHLCSSVVSNDRAGGTMTERVQVTIENGVADVRLNRPEKLNALDRPMFEALVAAGQRVSADRGVRAVVLSGEGRAFCAGLDFASFMAMAGEGSDPG